MYRSRFLYVNIKYSFCGMFQDLQYLRTSAAFAPLQTQNMQNCAEYFKSGRRGEKSANGRYRSGTSSHPEARCSKGSVEWGNGNLKGKLEDGMLVWRNRRARKKLRKCSCAYVRAAQPAGCPALRISPELEHSEFR